MDAAERQRIKLLCAELTKTAKRERPLPAKKQPPKPVAIGGHTSRAGAGSAYGAFVRTRTVGKCVWCSARVELPCRACAVRRLMELGAVEPLPPPYPETTDGHHTAARTHRR